MSCAAVAIVQKSVRMPQLDQRSGDFYESLGFRPGPRRNPGPDGGSRQTYTLRLLA